MENEDKKEDQKKDDKPKEDKDAKKDPKKKKSKKKKDDEDEFEGLDDKDIRLHKRYVQGPYAVPIAKIEKENKELVKEVNVLCGIRESDTGLSLPTFWNLQQDAQLLKSPYYLIGRCTKIMNKGEKDEMYMVRAGRSGKYVVGLGKEVAPTDVEEGMRIGVDV
jgi:26S proteasome regulatory subunit T1